LFLQEHSKFLQKGIPGKLPLEKREHRKEFLFFGRNLEVIPQDSWNWKAKKGTQKGMHNLVHRLFRDQFMVYWHFGMFHMVAENHVCAVGAYPNFFQGGLCNRFGGEQ
jgi:hypothetical protein